MVKVRLEGLPEEINAAAAVLKKSFVVLNVSQPSKNCGDSIYERIYVDVQLRKEKELNVR